MTLLMRLNLHFFMAQRSSFRKQEIRTRGKLTSPVVDVSLEMNTE